MVGVAITVNNSNHRNTQRLCFGNGNRLFIGINDEHQLRHAAHFFNTTQRAFQLFAFACQVENFFLGQATGSVAVQLFFQFAQALNGIGDGLPVGQRAAEPT